MMFNALFFPESCCWYPACFPSPNSTLLVGMIPFAALWAMLLFLSVLGLQRGGGCWGHSGLPHGSEGPQAGQSSGWGLPSLRSSTNPTWVLHPQSPRSSLRAVSLSRQLKCKNATDLPCQNLASLFWPPAAPCGMAAKEMQHLWEAVATSLHHRLSKQ